MKALTIMQPWAHAVVTGHKVIENRPWAPPPGMIGETFLVHAKKDRPDESWISWMTSVGVPERGTEVTGAIIGQVELAAVVARHELRVHCARYRETNPRWNLPPQITTAALKLWSSTEAGGEPDLEWCWLLRNPVLYDEPIPATGQQKLWTVRVDGPWNEEN